MQLKCFIALRDNTIGNMVQFGFYSISMIFKDKQNDSIIVKVHQEKSYQIIDWYNLCHSGSEK